MRLLPCPATSINQPSRRVPPALSPAAPFTERSANLTASLVYGGLSKEPAVACPSWDAASGSWQVPPDAAEHSELSRWSMRVDPLLC